MPERRGNVDPTVVSGFGDEWSRFDQSGADPAELERLFGEFFSLFPWDRLPDFAEGFDAGCGSGRWARLVAPRVGRIHCIDPSHEAIEVARRNLAHLDNCVFQVATVDDMALEDGSMDFGYSLGVLHHVPDTAAAMRACVRKLKPGAPFLVYLYYAFDNRPSWFRSLWRVSDVLRRWIASAPRPLRYGISQLIALSVYWPLARSARLLERTGRDVATFPLSFYRSLSFYVMRNDALDRFGTRLESRFTRAEVEAMMVRAGLAEITFREEFPYWCALGYRVSRCDDLATA